jgi:hypothetical protein
MNQSLSYFSLPMHEKLQDVFVIVQQNRNDIELLWKLNSLNRVLRLEFNDPLYWKSWIRRIGDIKGRLQDENVQQASIGFYQFLFRKDQVCGQFEDLWWNYCSDHNAIDQIHEFVCKRIHSRSSVDYEPLGDRIDASVNDLESFPERIFTFSTLKQLLIYENEIKSLPNMFYYLKELRELDVSDNQLAALPASIFLLPKLLILASESNQLTRLMPWTQPSLQELYLSGNQLTEFPDIRILTHLTRLELNSNSISEVPEWIGELHSLENLELQYNFLTKLPSSIAQLQHLKQLWLSGNNFGGIPTIIFQLHGLEYLQLNNIKCQNIPKDIVHLKCLQQLSMESNQLTTLPDELFELTSLERIEFT